MRLLRTLHKWIGLIAGAQLCVWLVSGLMMSLLDHHVVSGESTAAPAEAAAIAPADQPLIDPQLLLREAPSVRSIELQRLLQSWVWRVESESGVRLHDATTGAAVTIDAKAALGIAAAGRAGDLAPTRATLLDAPTMEARNHEPPLWRVDFKDAQRTRYYIDADDGRILERRTGDWSVFDVFWMLHTMDYRGRDDFHHPLVITFAFLSVWLALTGVLLLFRSFRKEIRAATKNT